MVAAKDLGKSYSLVSFGEGKKKGGALQHQKTCLETLERVRAVGNLSPEQRND